jgi:ribosomal protein S18 acetylase RimI-like enzyme
VEVLKAHSGSPLVDDAAQLWAEATAARDGDQDVAGLELSRPIIEGVLGSSRRSLLLIAREGRTAAGFAAIEPLGGTDEVTAELRYLGVSPGMWGRGVGELLLRELPQRLRAAGFGRAVLSVYTSNGRATALYERLGWQPAGPATPHPKTGKPEQRYELLL